ncbi:MAG: Gfo/Idh/MocA family oxidoreductase [Planctomycetes bacterium]|nr:Gfo/Idh/MocA family oxidoreductase [Planctomycetota bacterium]
MKEVKAAVIGVGHMGKNHARVLHQLPHAKLVAVVDTDEKSGKKIARKCRAEFHTDYTEIADVIDMASVAVPTAHHHRIAKDLLQRGVHVLIEKPMTKSVEEAEELVAIAKKHSAMIMVGHVERFNPAFMAIQERIRSPKFIEAHRLAPFSFRSADIGVVLDLMIHDIDIILHLIQSDIKRIDAAGANVLSDYEDVANARILFESGCVANVTASRVSIKSMRKIRVFSPNNYCSIDLLGREAVMLTKSPELTLKSLDISKLDASTIADLVGFVFGDLLRREKVKIDDHEPLKEEIESFVESIRNGTDPVVPGEQGIKTVKTARTIIDSIRRSMEAADIEPPSGLKM